MTPHRSPHTARIVLAVGAAAALAGTATGTARSVTPPRTGIRIIGSSASRSGSSKVVGVGGAVDAWLTSTTGSSVPTLCVGSPDTADPWCTDFDDDPALVVHRRRDNAIVGVVPAATVRVDVAWVDVLETAPARLGAPWRGIRTFGIDVDSLPGPTSDVRGALRISAFDADGALVLTRAVIAVEWLREFVPPDHNPAVRLLSEAAADGSVAAAVDGLGVWETKDGVCLGRRGDVAADGRFTPAAQAPADATARWWPMYCTDSDITDLADVWTADWTPPHPSAADTRLLIMPRAARHATLVGGRDLRLLPLGETTVTLLDVRHPTATLHVRGPSSTLFREPVATLLALPMPGFSPLRVVD